MLYPRAHLGDRYTNIYLGESQLSPGSVGILPLTTGHPKPLQRLRVRASPTNYGGFTLPMVSSPGFGSATLSLAPYSDSLSLRLPRLKRRVRLGKDDNSPDHSSIGTTLLARSTSSVCLLADNFRFYFTPFNGFFSPFPHGTGSLSVLLCI